MTRGGVTFTRGRCYFYAHVTGSKPLAAERVAESEAPLPTSDRGSSNIPDLLGGLNWSHMMIIEIGRRYEHSYLGKNNGGTSCVLRNNLVIQHASSMTYIARQRTLVREKTLSRVPLLTYLKQLYFESSTLKFQREHFCTLNIFVMSPTDSYSNLDANSLPLHISSRE